MQVSKSQIRAAKLLGVECDPINDEYPELASRLESVNVSGDGLPSGYDWRKAGKLSDAELVAKLVESSESLAAYHIARVDFENN